MFPELLSSHMHVNEDLLMDWTGANMKFLEQEFWVRLVYI